MEKIPMLVTEEDAARDIVAWQAPLSPSLSNAELRGAGPTPMVDAVLAGAGQQVRCAMSVRKKVNNLHLR
jgi:hypothetical protein